MDLLLLLLLLLLRANRGWWLRPIIRMRLSRAKCLLLCMCLRYAPSPNSRNCFACLHRHQWLLSSLVLLVSQSVGSLGFVWVCVCAVLFGSSSSACQLANERQHAALHFARGAPPRSSQSARRPSRWLDLLAHRSRRSSLRSGAPFSPALACESSRVV